MEYKDDIGQLFKNTFENYEADVNPDAWVNIQNGLNLQPASNAGSASNNVSTGAKLTAASSKLSVMSIFGITAAIIGITATLIYFSSDNEVTDNKQANEIKTESAPPVIAPANTEDPSSSEVGNIKSEKQPSSETSPEAGNTDNNTNQKNLTSKETAAYYSSTNEDVAVSAMDKKNVAEVTDTKNTNTEATLQNNHSETPPVADKKSNENNTEEEETLNQNTDAGVNAATPEAKEEINPEQFLGQIPNVITPNSDGDNDAFIIEGKNLLSLKVSIIDRSGKIIHSWKGLHGFWDGKLENGQPAKAGIYFYDIFAQTNTGHPLSTRGTIHLLLK